MLIVMRSRATDEDIARVQAAVKEMGFTAYPIPGTQRTAIGVLGNEKQVDASGLQGMAGVKEIIHVSKPYKLVGREFKDENTVVSLGAVRIGDGSVAIMAGPCSVENRKQVVSTALQVAAGGACVLRGGAFKPRTSPYAFQGLGKEGVAMLAEARKASGLPFVTEVIDEASLEICAPVADMIQIGARNMQNFSLLKMAGQAKKPVLLKRGMSATIKDLLMSAEYIMSEGNPDVVLCERGIRTFSDASRNTLDICAVPYIKAESHLPVIVDPSHATGAAGMVPPIALAGIAAGADGLMIEVHPHPREACSDGPQSLVFDQFKRLVAEIEKLAEALGKTITRISR